jgi:hypothetical protein
MSANKRTPSLEVQAKPCTTCIYRADSPLDLARLEAAIADPHLPGYFTGHRVCHHSASAVCAGFWARHRDHFTLGQLAQRLGWVRKVHHDTLA